MLKKVFYAIIITTLIVLSVLLIHGVLYGIFPIEHRSINFTITLVYTFYFLCAAVLMFNVYLQFLQRYRYFIAVVLAFLVSYPALESLSVRPYRSLLLIGLTIFSMTVSIMMNSYSKERSYKFTMK